MTQRNTVQRQLVLEAAYCLDHPAAEDVYSHITVDHPSVSKATVYRNLNLLVEVGRLRKVAVPGGADRFDTTLNNHYHFTCRHCGSVMDASFPYREDLSAPVEAGGFLVESHDILFQGLCSHCRNAQPAD